MTAVILHTLIYLILCRFECYFIANLFFNKLLSFFCVQSLVCLNVLGENQPTLHKEQSSPIVRSTEILYSGSSINSLSLALCISSSYWH